MGRYDDYIKEYNGNYADGHYIRKAKAERDNNVRDMLIDMKMRQVSLDTQRRCEMELYLPLQTGFKYEQKAKPLEYQTKKKKNEHLYGKCRDKLFL